MATLYLRYKLFFILNNATSYVIYVKNALLVIYININLESQQFFF